MLPPLQRNDHYWLTYYLGLALKVMNLFVPKKVSITFSEPKSQYEEISDDSQMKRKI